jgi:hypothetical protein
VRTDTSIASAATISLGDLERQLRSETPAASTTTGFDILLPQHFISIRRGKTRVRYAGAKRECSIELQTQITPRIGGPAAAFGSRGLGWLDTLEVVLLNTDKRTLMWKRTGKQTEITINGKSAGRMEIGWCLQHFGIGSGSVWFDGDPFCKIELPVFGPSSPQPHDCTGRFTFASDQKVIRFLISPKSEESPKELESSNVPVKSGFALNWAKLRDHAVRIAEKSQAGADLPSNGTIFYPSDEARLTQLSAEQRMLLLSLAVWPWSLYKRGGA